MPDRGDVVLVRFVFADERGQKRRPVLVLSGGSFHAGRDEVIVAAMTSNTTRRLVGDHTLESWREAGLPKPTLVTAILRTITRGMVERTFGRLTPGDLRAYLDGVAPHLGLTPG